MRLSSLRNREGIMRPIQQLPPVGARTVIAAVFAVLGAAARHGVAAAVIAWTRWESGLVSSKLDANPYADVTVSESALQERT